MTMFQNGSITGSVDNVSSQAVIDSHVSRKLRLYTAVFELASSAPLNLP